MSNRDIKFRAWSNDLDCYFYAPSESWSIAFHSESIVAQMWCSDGLVDEIPIDVIEQFTGLIDENGNEIYEGDILEDDEHYYSVISWDNEDSMYVASGVGGLSDMFFPVKVIGNIHQNPELLEKHI